MLHDPHRVKRAAAPALAVTPRVARLAAIALASAATVVHAQSIGVFADAAGTNPCIQLSQFKQTTFYIQAQPGGAVPGFSFVEFRVAGLVPNAPWFINIDPLPWIDACLLGCQPFGAGVIMAFPSCITTPFNLLTVHAFVTGEMPAMEWTVTPHALPSNPLLGCPVMGLPVRTICEPSGSSSQEHDSGQPRGLQLSTRIR
jgi:hypothetical protein